MRLFLVTMAAVGMFSSAAFAQTDGQYRRHAQHHRAAVISANAEASFSCNPGRPGQWPLP